MGKKKEKEQPGSLKQTEKEEVAREEKGWVRIKFQLQQQNWRFANFECLFNVKDPMLYIEQKLVQNHGLIKDVRIYTDFEQQNRLNFKFSDQIGQVFQTEGNPLRAFPLDITVYYDFKLGFKCPLLLY